MHAEKIGTTSQSIALEARDLPHFYGALDDIAHKCTRRCSVWDEEEEINVSLKEVVKSSNDLPIKCFYFVTNWVGKLQQMGEST